MDLHVEVSPIFFLLSAFFAQLGMCLAFSALDLLAFRRVGIGRMAKVVGVVALQMVSIILMWWMTRGYMAWGTEQPLTFTTFAWQFVVYGTIGDFLFYCQHRMMHASPFLRNHIHYIHHHDGEDDVGKEKSPMHSWMSFRVHPVEASIIVISMFAPFVLFAHPAVLVAFAVFTTAHGATTHAGYEKIALCSLGASCFVSPDQHELHHHGNTLKNYGNILNIWDDLFGTFEPVSKTLST